MLFGANLTQGHFERASFKTANLVGANLAGASLAGTDFTGANFAHTNIVGADLSQARGLNQAQIDLACGPYRIVSLMSREAADELGLKPGDQATAVVKSTTVIIESR